MSIYQVEISNFQSIKQQRLDLSGFTVICGRSDIGKSAFRRAIQTALFNNWSKSFIRNNAKQTKVSVSKLSDNPFSVTAYKSATDNTFVINDKTLPKMGKESPVIPDHRFNQQLNIATQLEPLYMVAYKDTENTRILNQLFGIDVLETAQQLCATDLRRNKQELNYKTTLLESKKSELKQTEQRLLHIRELHSAYQFISELKELINRYISIQNNISVSIDEQRPINQQLKDISSKIQTLSHAGILSKYLQKTKSIEQNNTYLYNLNDELSNLPQESALQSIIDNHSTISKYLSVKSTKEKLEKHPYLSISLKSVSRLPLLYKYLSVKSKAPSIQEIEDTDEQVSKLNLELSKMVCPTCNQPLDNHTHNGAM